MPTVPAQSVVELYQFLRMNGIVLWIDGGWGVDALLEEQTRSHADLDIVIQHKDVTRLRELLETRGYQDVTRGDPSAWNFVLGDSQGHLVDVHVIVFDAEGNGIYGPAGKGETYPAASLTGEGKVDGYPVKRISAEWLVRWHSGYKLDEDDIRDVSALCERFGIAFPKD